ncbi:MAG: class I SAM-dependent methyltransferase [Planctomycetota bacterium]
MNPTTPDELDRAQESIRLEYDRRRQQPPARSLGPGVYAARLARYDELFRDLGLLPLAHRRVLDMGCANGSWLEQCCRRWGARPENCAGVDLREAGLLAWRAAHPDATMQLLCGSAHATPFGEASFDVVHQSMMLSSIPNRALRDETARHAWTRLRPGGVLISYDLWWNPVNPHTIGITWRELRRLFPEGRMVHFRRLTLAPPLSRLLAPLGAAPLAGLERLRVLNTHYLVAFGRDAQ